MSPFVLSLLKYSLLVLLYLFVFRAIRSVTLDVAGRKRSATTQMRIPAGPGTATASRGGGAPRQVVVHDAESGGKARTLELSGTMDVGRGDGCAIRLQDTYVSQVHARLYGRDGAWYVEDLGSTNGTLLNDRRVQAAVEVHDGDIVRLGKTTLELRR